MFESFSKFQTQFSTNIETCIALSIRRRTYHSHLPSLVGDSGAEFEIPLAPYAARIRINEGFDSERASCLSHPARLRSALCLA